MKKKSLTALLLILSFCLFAVAFSSCGKYVSKYELTDCSLSQSEHNNPENTIEYGRKYESSDFTVFFDSALTDERVIDSWIDRISALSGIIGEKGCQSFYTFYLSDNLIANYLTDASGEKSMFFPSKISEEETLAWMLLSQFSDSDLPYGIYAGVAAHWLNKTEYADFTYSAEGGNGYLTELQFPLYEKNNLKEKDREYAWSFSYSLVSDWLSSGKDERELMSLKKEQLNSYLSEKYDRVLPDYAFYPHSTQYEYRVEQGCFTYYINKQYNDLVLPTKVFTTSYDCLADWLKDNAAMTAASNNALKISDMYPINVYLDDGLKSPGITGRAYKEPGGIGAIELYSVGWFSHEYIHHILYKRDKGVYLREVICELQANDSKYASSAYYYLLSGRASKFPYASSVKEQKTYVQTLRLYNKKSAVKAADGSFDIWLFADCFSAIHTKANEPFVSRLQLDSLYKYIADRYGDEYVWELNTNPDLKIDGKGYDEIIPEWLNYLQEFAK